MISLEPRLLGRYRQIVALLMRHGGRELLGNAQLDETLVAGDAEASVDPGGSGPEALARDLERMGPTFVKIGQLLSTRPDLLPKAYCRALARLQDHCRPVPFEEIEQVVTTELGVRLSKAFAEFDRQPLASASLAQVHRARLRDGRPVAVKVQRPGIREQVLCDLDALEELAELLDRHSDTARRYQALATIRHFRSTLLCELDFGREAGNLIHLGRSLAEFDRLVIPRPVPDYSTARLLVMDYVDGSKLDELSGVVHTEIDGKQLAEQLFRAYLYQVLVDGTFHADPHPGNVLLTRDHRLALIDLGMVGHFQRGMQRRLIKLLLALSEGRGDEVASLALDLAGEAERDEAGFRVRIGTLVAEHRDVTIQQVRVGMLLLEVCRTAAGHGVMLPVELSVLGKTLLHLDEVGRLLDPELDPNATIRRYASQVLRKQMNRDTSPGSLMSALIETRELIEGLPGRANRVLEILADNKLRLHVDAIDEERLTTSLERVANRITAGLVLAALIVGASLLMRVETDFTLLGYPGLAMLLFLAAAGGGMWLVWRIFRDHRSW